MGAQRELGQWSLYTYQQRTSRVDMLLCKRGKACCMDGTCDCSSSPSLARESRVSKTTCPAVVIKTQIKLNLSDVYVRPPRGGENLKRVKD